MNRLASDGRTPRHPGAHRTELSHHRRSRCPRRPNAPPPDDRAVHRLGPRHPKPEPPRRPHQLLSASFAHDFPRSDVHLRSGEPSAHAHARPHRRRHRPACGPAAFGAPNQSCPIPDRPDPPPPRASPLLRRPTPPRNRPPTHRPRPTRIRRRPGRPRPARAGRPAPPPQPGHPTHPARPARQPHPRLHPPAAPPRHAPQPAPPRHPTYRPAEYEPAPDPHHGPHRAPAHPLPPAPALRRARPAPSANRAAPGPPRPGGQAGADRRAALPGTLAVSTPGTRSRLRVTKAARSASCSGRSGKGQTPETVDSTQM